MSQGNCYATNFLPLPHLHGITPISVLFVPPHTNKITKAVIIMPWPSYSGDD